MTAAEKEAFAQLTALSVSWSDTGLTSVKLPGNTANIWSARIRLLLTALSSQAEVMEAMAKGLEAMRREFCNPMVRRALGGHNEAQMEAVLNARTALSQYCSLGGE